MTNYTKTTNFATKDTLPSGNANKIVKGTEIDTEFNNIATAVATKADTAGPTFTGTTTFETLSDGTISITAFVDEDNMASDSATLLPTQQSVKAYVDSQVTAQDLDFQADSGGALSIDLDSETLTFTGGTGVDTSGSGNAVTFAIDSTVATLAGTQTLTNKTLTSPTLNTPTIGTSFTIGSATITEAELEILDGATVTTAELNILDGVTATTAELNYVDGVTSAIQTQIDAKAPLASPTFSGTVTTAAITGTSATFTVTDNSDNLSLVSSDTDDNSGPNLRMYRNSSSPGDNYALGQIDFEGKNDASQDVRYGFISAKISDASDGTEDGQLRFFTIAGGTETQTMTLDSGRVGIGVTPEAWTVFNPVLQIGRGAIAGSSNTNIRIFSNTYYDGAYKRIATGAVSKYEQADGNHIWYSNPSAAADSTFTPDEHMRLDPSGNVGIGVIPDGALSLESPSYTAGGIANGIRFQNGNNTADAIIQSYYSGTSSSALLHGVNSYLSTGAAFTAIDTNKPSSYFLQNTNGSFDFGSAQTGNPSSKVTIGTSGNVTIGSVASGVATATPVELNLGSTFANSAGSLSKAKLKIFEDSSGTVYGLSVSNGLMEFGAPSSAGFAFFINEDEKARIDSSGNLLVGDTSSSFPTNVQGVKIFTANIGISHNTSNNSGDSYVRFGYSTNTIGSITQNGTTAVLYNTSSDQRLKENIVDAPSASDDIDAIQVRSFDWKADGSHQKYGMVAQELQGVAPEAVSAPEDPDEMMGVDYSKLVPMLVKEIQSLRARVAQLEQN